MITGASEGIGAACARALRDRGAKLSLNARSPEKLARAALPGDATTAGDITQSTVREAFVNTTLERFGRIDILINNAGRGIYSPISTAPESETRSVFELNFFAPMLLVQAVAPHLRKQRSGVIVNIGSIAGQITLPWMPFYSASKFALGSMTAGLRMELARDGVHAMLVCPGYVKTQFQAHAVGQAPTDVESAKRFAITPEQCAADILRGIERRAAVVTTPRWGGLIVAASQLLPGFVESRLSRVNVASERT